MMSAQQLQKFQTFVDKCIFSPENFCSLGRTQYDIVRPMNFFSNKKSLLFEHSN